MEERLNLREFQTRLAERLRNAAEKSGENAKLGFLAGGRHWLTDLDQVGEVGAMDAAQTRALRGPRADPAAWLIVRPYLPESVYIEVAGRPAGRPYWLIASRTPARLAAAIDAARSRAAGQASCDDDALDNQLAGHGKDGNAR